MIEGYMHSQGKFYETMVQKNIYNFLGFDIKEEILFGLDSAFGFMFFNNKNNKIDPIVGNCEIFSLNASKLLGVKIQKMLAFNEKQRKQKIVASINNGIPLISRVDIAYLPYWRLPKDVNFGGYFIVICGYDKKSDKFYISDNHFSEIQEIAANDLLLAQSSKKSHPINPNNTIYECNKVSTNNDLAKTGLVALRKTIRNYLRPHIKNFGISGLKLLSNSIVDWFKYKNGEIEEVQYNGEIVKYTTLNYQLLQFFKTIDGFEGGAGLQRSLMSDFLISLFKELNNTAIQDSANLLLQSSFCWNSIASFIKDAISQSDKNVSSGLLAHIKSEIDEIIKIEENAFNTLKKI